MAGKSAMQAIQERLYGKARDEEKDIPGVAVWTGDANLDKAGKIFNILLNLSLLVVVLALGTVAGGLYVTYTDTGSSKFLSFLRNQGYGEQAIAYEQVQRACLDTSNTLHTCKGVAWLYLHPEISVWPARSPEGKIVSVARAATHD